MMRVDLEEIQEERRDLLAVIDEIKIASDDAKQRLKVEKTWHRPRGTLRRSSGGKRLSKTSLGGNRHY